MTLLIILILKYTVTMECKVMGVVEAEAEQEKCVTIILWNPTQGETVLKILSDTVRNLEDG